MTFLFYLPSDVPPSRCCKENKESRRRNLQTGAEQQSGSTAKERDSSFSPHGPTGVDPVEPLHFSKVTLALDPESAVVSGEAEVDGVAVAPKIAPETYIFIAYNTK